MAEVLQPDICVIGAGAGGLAVAAAAAAFGVSVVLIEKARMGGECLNAGCVPSKTLLAAAKRLAMARDADGFGIATGDVTSDFAKVQAHVKAAVAAVAPNDSRERFKALGVRVIDGHAHFIDRETVTVGSDIAIKARRFVIATGSSPSIPLIAGLQNTPYLTNETIFDLNECPRHLIVVGTGSVGIELAQAYRRLGANVTVLEAATPLASDDPECATVVLDQLVREGVIIKSGVTIKQVQNDPPNITVEIESAAGTERIDGSHVLLAAGRRPNTDGLQLEAARIRHNARGIVVNRQMRTKNRKVYAVGDVAGGPQFTHVASHHAGLVIRNVLFGLRAKVRYSIVPRVTYTDPELAQVGMTEATARQRKMPIRILRWAYHGNDRAQIERTTQGHIKVLTDTGGRILGVTIVGAQAGELIVTWTLAVSQGLNIRAMAELVTPYPTLSEIGKRAAISYFTPSLTRPLVQRIIRLLRWAG